MCGCCYSPCPVGMDPTDLSIHQLVGFGAVCTFWLLWIIHLYACTLCRCFLLSLVCTREWKCGSCGNCVFNLMKRVFQSVCTFYLPPAICGGSSSHTLTYTVISSPSSYSHPYFPLFHWCLGGKCISTMGPLPYIFIPKWFSREEAYNASYISYSFIDHSTFYINFCNNFLRSQFWKL